MTNKIISARPAGAAIAAVLALATPPLMAQALDAPQTAPPVGTAPPAPVAPEAAPQVTPPVGETPAAVAAPAPEAPTAAAAAAPQAPVIRMAPLPPVVQATPPVAEPDPAKVAPAAPAAREAAKPAGTTAAAPESVTPAPVATQTPPIADTAPPVALAEPAPVAEPAPAPVSTVTSSDALNYGLGAAGVLAVLGIGGAMLARRRRKGEADAPPAYTVASTEPRSPADAMRVYNEAAAPAPVMPPQPAMTVPPIMARTANADAADAETLEAMVAAAPSPENPFLTRAKRMRRAQYLLQRQAEAAAKTVAPSPAPPEMAYDSARSIPVDMREDRSQTVHSFGKQPNFRFQFKPAKG